MESTQRYGLTVNEAEIARLRRQNEALGDEARFLLDQIDVRPGWRVIDVGCGPVGLLEALADRVGSSGSVVGLDVHEVMVAQARAVVAASGRRNIDVIQADAADTGLPRGSFDLVHARLVLINVPRSVHQAILTEMTALARPGGVVALEEIDGASWGCEPNHPAWERLYGAFLALWKQEGYDAFVGRRLQYMARQAGLTDVETKVHARFYDRSHVWRHLLAHFIEISRARIVKAGLLTSTEIDELKAELAAHLEKPDTTVLSPTLTQAWGRKALN